MRVVELMVDGQRIKLTTDDNVLRAINVGDLKPSTRVVIWEHDEEVFVGAAVDDPQLREVFPAHMLPVTPFKAQSTVVPEEPKASVEVLVEAGGEAVERATTVPVTPPGTEIVSVASSEEPRREPKETTAQPHVMVTQVHETPIVSPPAPGGDSMEAMEQRLLAARRLQMSQQLDREAGAAALSQKPRPWRHWLAKSLDLPILSNLSILIGGFVGLMIWPDAGPQAMLIGVPIFFMLEALIMKIFGATPGKALLNIKVRKNGQHIGFFAGIGRSIQSHVVGAGAWIPVLSVVVMLAARQRMLETGRSAWDLGAGNQVIYGKIGVLRWLIIIGIFVGLYLLVAATAGL